MRYICGMPFSPFEPDRPPAKRRRFRQIPFRTLLPNLITLLALCAGLTGIRLAIEGKLEWAVYAIVFAAVLDGIDGRVARMLKGTSRFGAELDSLADFVNFGVAPALILYFWGLHELGNVGWIAAMVFAICAGLRLARFNVMIDDPNRPAWAANFFVGMPAPAGAITVLLPIYVYLPRHAALGLHRAGDLPLHARDRLPDGVAAAGVLRQARRQARGARDGAAGLRRGGAVLRAADLLSVVVLTIGTVAYLASLPFGWLSYREYERKDAAAGVTDDRAGRGAAAPAERESPSLSPGSARPRPAGLIPTVRRASELTR